VATRMTSHVPASALTTWNRTTSRSRSV